MRMKPVEPTAVIRDPHTKAKLPAEGGDVPDNTFWNRRWLAGETWRREDNAWVRRLATGELERIEDASASTPTGNEPVAPLTTRAAPRK